MNKTIDANKGLYEINTLDSNVSNIVIVRYTNRRCTSSCRWLVIDGKVGNFTRYNGNASSKLTKCVLDAIAEVK